MITEISVPHLDHRAADLAWSLTRTEEPALAGLVIDSAFGRVDLRVLGTSHQVVVEAPGVRLVETVAAPGSTDEAGPMPRRQAVDVDEVRYTFHSVVARPEDFDATVADLARDLGNDPRGVAGVFGDEGGGLTGLRVARATADELTWEAWHCYPASGEVVSTASALTR